MNSNHHNPLDQVIDRFDSIIKWSQQTESNIGVFALIYKRTTCMIRAELEKGDVFDDNQRMARLIVVFAERYFDAFSAYQLGNQITGSWRIAFEAAEDPSTSLIQNLILGINAHMSLDLGIACHEVLQGSDPMLLKNDFKKIERVLTLIMSEVIESVGKLSPWLKLITRLFSINSVGGMKFVSRARLISWSLTERMAGNDSCLHQYLIRVRDAKASRWSRFVYQPGLVLQPLIMLIKRFEEKDLSLVFQTLA